MIDRLAGSRNGNLTLGSSGMADMEVLEMRGVLSSDRVANERPQYGCHVQQPFIDVIELGIARTAKRRRQESVH